MPRRDASETSDPRCFCSLTSACVSAVVRCLFRDDHVMHVRLAEPLRRRADELGVRAEVLDRRRARSPSRREDRRRAGARSTRASRGTARALDASGTSFVCGAGLTVAGFRRIRAPEPMPRYAGKAAGPGRDEIAGALIRCPRRASRSSRTLAPAAIAFVTSPEYLMPPSAMIGTSWRSATRAQSLMVVIWGRRCRRRRAWCSGAGRCRPSPRRHRRR